MMKKLLLIIVVAMMTACAGNKPSMTTGSTKESDKLNVVVTTSFLEDMVNVLVGDKVNTQLIIPAGEDPHTYEAKPEDNTKLQNADLVLYHGLHFEGKMVELLEAIGAVSVSQNFDESKVGRMEENGETIIDPHFWFDIDLYKQATQEAAKALEDKLPDLKDEIEENLQAYLKKLDELDAYNREQLNQSPADRRILITPHDAFNYFSRRYGITVKAPQGVSTDAELSNSDMAETAAYIVEHQVKAIFAETTTDPARMEKLKESCKAKGFDVKVVGGEGKELFSDSLAPKGQPGDTYIDMYRFNVDLIVSNLK